MSLDFIQNKSKFHCNQDGERNKNEHRSEEYYFVFLPRFFLLLIYLLSVISTASKSKRTLQKLGVRSGTDPGMNRCTENISHGDDHEHVIRSRQLIYTAGLSLRKD